jgi:O-antigen/teichoic acid export membrane protein
VTSLRQEAARGLKWHVLEIVGRQFLALAVFTILARLLQPSDFGLLGMVAAYLVLVNMFVDQGIGTALIQRQHLEPQHLDAAFWFILACAIGLCGLTVASADLLAGAAGEPRLASLLRWASLAMVFNAASAVHAVIFIKRLEFEYLTLRTWVANTVAGGIAVTMALTEYGVWALIVQQLVSSLVGMCFLWHVSPWRPSLRFSLAHLRELMTVSASVFASSLLWVFSTRIDQLVIGRFAGVGVLGYYVIGIRLAEVARAAIHEPMAAISLPAFAKVQDDHQRLRDALYRGIELHAVICFAAFVGLAAVAPSVVPLIFGAHWGDAGPILQVVAIYSLVVALSVFFHPALLASGGIGRYVFVNVLCAAGATTACLVGVQFGVRAVVLLLTLNMLMISAVALAFLRQRIQLAVWRFCRACAAPAFAALVMFAAAFATRMALDPVVPLIVRTGAEIVAGAGVYILLIWRLAPGTVPRLMEVAIEAFSLSGRRDVDRVKPPIAGDGTVDRDGHAARVTG